MQAINGSDTKDLREAAKVLKQENCPPYIFVNCEIIFFRAMYQTKNRTFNL